MPMAERRTPDRAYGMLGGAGRLAMNACRRARDAVMTGSGSFHGLGDEPNKKTRQPR
jgi:hypothetical protein